MIHVPVVVRYTFRACGRAEHHVTCEACSTEFVYVIAREATALVLSPFDVLTERFVTARGRAKANRKLQQKLGAPDLVACPSCGWYQDHMVRYLKRQRLRIGLPIALATSALVGLLGLLATAFTEKHWMVVGLGLALGLVGIVVAVWYVTRDPNACLTEYERKLRAENSRGSTLAEYGEQQARREARGPAGDIGWLGIGDHPLPAGPETIGGPTASVPSAYVPTSFERLREQKRAREDRQHRSRRDRIAAMLPVIATGVAAVLGAVLDVLVCGPADWSLAERAIGGLFGAAVGGASFFFPVFWLYYASLSKHRESLVQAILERDEHRRAGLNSPRNPCPIAAMLGAVCGAALLAAGGTAHGYAWVLGSEVASLILLRLVSSRDSGDNMGVTRNTLG